jgi:two-component sensor histidine kinase
MLGVLAERESEILTLAVHELATNAMKYGALSQPIGQVVIAWEVEPGPRDDWLHLTWQEHGVAIAPDPSRRQGFGTVLVMHRVPYELKGRGQIDLNPDGLRCEIAFPLIPGESTLQTDAPAVFRSASPTKG